MSKRQVHLRIGITLIKKAPFSFAQLDTTRTTSQQHWRV